jgi:hypothetical protein
MTANMANNPGQLRVEQIADVPRIRGTPAYLYLLLVKSFVGSSSNLC